MAPKIDAAGFWCQNFEMDVSENEVSKVLQQTLMIPLLFKLFIENINLDEKNPKNFYLETPIHCAADNGHLDIRKEKGLNNNH